MHQKIAEGQSEYLKKVFDKLLPNSGDSVILFRTGGGERIEIVSSAKYENDVLVDYSDKTSGSLDKIPSRGGKEPIDKTKGFEVGWYQDANGKLSRFDGTSFDAEIELATIEFIGGYDD